MRGKGSIKGHALKRAGITPAYAGKRSLALCSIHQHRDHPRVCGEKQMQEQAGKYWVGSPPRMRGKETYLKPRDYEHRITPACAGKSYHS